MFSATLASPVDFVSMSYTTLSLPTSLPTSVGASKSQVLVAERTINTARGGGFIAPGWAFIACFTDERNARALRNPVQIAGGPAFMSVEHCNYRCEVDNYLLSGVEFGHECWCDHALNGEYHVKVDESECNMRCPGNSTQSCGGADRIAIYEYNFTQVATVTAERPSPAGRGLDARSVEINSLYLSIGCYSDLTSNRTLGFVGDFPGAKAGMTIEPCLGACQDAGYVFAGVEFGKECWCDNVIRGIGTLTSDSDCNMPCSGNASESCGGSNRINIYQFTPATTTNAATPGTATSTSATPASATTPASSTLICIMYYKVAQNDYCYDIWTSFRISQEQFRSWNPSLAFPQCQISVDQPVCVQQGPVSSSVLTVTGLPPAPTPTDEMPATALPPNAMTTFGASTIATPTTTPIATTPTTGTSISTSPAPTLSCSVFYRVAQSEYCYEIWTSFGISQEQFTSWNPSLVFPQCQIFPGDFLCVQLGRSSTTTFTTLPPTPTPTSSSDFSSTTTITTTTTNTVTFSTSMPSPMSNTAF
jgi:hypothetical protein